MICDLCYARFGHSVIGTQKIICTICEVKLVEDKVYINGMSVDYKNIPVGLYKK